MGDRVGAHPSHQDRPPGGEGFEHLAIGIVGVGEKQESMSLAKDVIKHETGLVDERPAVAIGEHQPLVDAGANGHAEVVSPDGARQEPVGLDRVAVEEVQDPLVVGSIEAKRPDETGDAERIAAHGECNEDENEPEEGFCSRECGAEDADDLPPV